MDTARYKRAEEIFHAAVSLSTEAREALLEHECTHDHELHAFVQQLLYHDSTGMGDFMRQSPVTPIDEYDAHVAPTLPTHIGRYEIVRVIGEGGMGIVYEARQEHPHRTVALKAIRSGLPSRSLLRRFQHEAEILGQLQHPGIAHIYEASTAEVDGFRGAKLRQPYFAMEYVTGESLGKYADLNGLDTRKRLALFAKICDAVQHAHQKGVIHRDLKPGNIIVDSTGQPKILDFGVARATDADMQTVTMQTNIGQLIGTVPYMSPEQVTGDSKQLDTRSDVYSLGVILYELISGALPYEVRDRSIAEAARVIRDEEPTRLTTIARALRGEIETIVRRTLEKDKGRRYQSASDLAADIRHYLRGEPIEAKRDSTLYVLRKTIVRHRRLTAAAILFTVLLSVFGTVSFIQAQRNRRLAIRERVAHGEATAALTVSNIERGRLLGRTGHLAEAEDLIWREFLIASDSNHAFWALWELYSRSLGLATLGRIDDSRCLAFAPNGRFVAAGGHRGDLKLWDLVAGRHVADLPGHTASITGVHFSPDSRFLVSVCIDGIANVWEVESHATVTTIRDAHGGFHSARYSPDGRYLLTGSGDCSIKLWDPLTGECVRTLAEHDAGVRCLQFSRDGSLLASSSDDGIIKLWRGLLGPSIATLKGHRRYVLLAFSRDGQKLASGGQDKIIRIWDLSTYECTRTLNPSNGSVRLLHFIDDGRLLVGGWWRVDLWDISTAEYENLLPQGVDGAEMNADGRLLAHAASDDLYGGHAVRVSEVESQGGLLRLDDSGRGPVAVSLDGRVIAASGGEGQIQLWATATGRLLATLAGHPSYGASCHFDPTGTLLATCGSDHVVKLWDLSTGREVNSFDGHHRATHRSLSFSPDGESMATTRQDKTVQIREVSTCRVLLTIPSTGKEALSVSYSPDGKTIAVAYRSGGVRLYSPSGESVAHLKTIACPWTVAFRPDGRKLAIGCWGQQFQIWDLTTYTRDAQFLELRSVVWGVAYMPNDPNILATCSDDGTIRLWDLHTRLNLLLLEPFGRFGANSVGFTPDGKTLVASSSNGSVCAWDLEYYQRHMAGHVRFYMDQLRPELGDAIQKDYLAAWSDDVLSRPWPRIGPHALRQADSHSPTTDTIGVDPAIIASWSHRNTGDTRDKRKP
ncbi:MAG: serine/threonine-protein kinase [Planctomycetota bacterium]